MKQNSQNPLAMAAAAILLAWTGLAAANEHSRANEPESYSQLDRTIAAVGFAWGYIKYHHPYLYDDCAAWDAELADVVAAIESTNGTQPVDAYIDEWLQRIRDPSTDELPTSDLLSHSHGVALAKRHLPADAFGIDIASVLVTIRRDDVPELQKCMRLGENSAGNALFDQEASYEDLNPPDRYFRIVALMRYWNMVEYWFPYRDLIDEDWNLVLVDSVSQFLGADTELAYRAALLRLIARIDDTHASLWTAGKAMPPGGWELSPFVIRDVEGQPYVGKPLPTTIPVDNPGVRVGDVILEVDGVAVQELVEEWRPFYGTSNDAALRRDVYQNLLRGDTNSLQVKVERDGELLTVPVPLISMRDVDLAPTYSYDLDGDALQIIDDDIAYLKLSAVEKDELPSYIDRIMGKRGLIVDIRGYPNTFVVFSLGQRLVSEPTPFAKFTWPNPHRPGEFHWTAVFELQPQEPVFDGPVAILINERSQSQSEYTAMALRASPNAIVIGSQTAGADGNISRIVLPGAEQTTFSGLGVFYPDESPTQQIGIVPDYEVLPTIEGLRSGKDEVLDAALTYFHFGSIPAFNRPARQIPTPDQPGDNRPRNMDLIHEMNPPN